VFGAGELLLGEAGTNLLGVTGQRALQATAVAQVAGTAYGASRLMDMESTPFNPRKRGALSALAADGQAVRVQDAQVGLCRCKITYGVAKRNVGLLHRYILNKMIERRVTRFQSITDLGLTSTGTDLLSFRLDCNRHVTRKETYLPFYIFRLNCVDRGAMHPTVGVAYPYVCYRLTMRDATEVKYSDAVYANNKAQFYWKAWDFGLRHAGPKGVDTTNENKYRLEFSTSTQANIDAYSHEWSRIKMLLKGQKPPPSGAGVIFPSNGGIVRYGVCAFSEVQAPTHDYYLETSPTPVPMTIVDGDMLQRSDAYWRTYWAGKLDTLAHQGIALNSIKPRYYASRHACMNASVSRDAPSPKVLVDYVFNNGTFYNMYNYEAMIDNITNQNIGDSIVPNLPNYPATTGSNDNTLWPQRFEDERFFYVTTDEMYTQVTDDTSSTDGHCHSFDIIIRNAISVVPS